MGKFRLSRITGTGSAPKLPHWRSVGPFAVLLLDVIRDFVVNCLLMPGLVSANPLTAMFLREGHTVLMPSRRGQFSRTSLYQAGRIC